MRQIPLLLLFIIPYKCFCQHSADAIIGKWLKIPKEDLIIEVFREKDQYNGKISWTKDNSKKKPVGYEIIEKLKYNPKSDKWENGEITDPNSGSTYSAAAKIKSDSTLEVNGYVGFSFFGIKKNFRKIK